MGSEDEELFIPNSIFTRLLMRKWYLYSGKSTNSPLSLKKFQSFNFQTFQSKDQFLTFAAY